MKLHQDNDEVLTLNEFNAMARLTVDIPYDIAEIVQDVLPLVFA